MSETVITLRSAKDYRDAGIRYGVYRTMFVGSAILMVFGIIPFGLGFFTGTDSLIKFSLALEGIPAVVMILSNGMMKFPHLPEITEVDVEKMDDFGIPEAVIRNSLNESVFVSAKKGTINA
jgi:hypothetical protein